MLTSSDSNITIIAQETMSFIEYFSFITGSFGTWFGFSFLSLNTPKIMKLAPGLNKHSNVYPVKRRRIRPSPWKFVPRS